MPKTTATLLFFAALLLAATLVLAPVLLQPDAVLAFNDANIESVLSPASAFPGSLVRLWDNQFFFGLGSRQYSLTGHALFELVFGAHEFRRWGVAVLLALCGLACAWCLRAFGFSRGASAVAALLVVFSGFPFTFAVAGLPVRPLALAFAALALGFMEKGRLANRGLPYAVAGGFTGLAVAEVPDVGALLALAVAGLFVWRHWPRQRREWREAWRPLLRLMLLVGCSFLVAFQAVNTMLATNITGVSQGGADTPEAQYDWATQWSIPVEESWDLVAGSYFGASMRSPRAPYWGRMGRTPGWETHGQGMRNFKLTGWHLGVVPCLLLLLLPWLPRPPRNEPTPGGDRRWLWLVTIGGVLCLMLSWGRFFPLYRLVHALPFFHTMRNPDKWNGPFTLMALFGLALTLERLLTISTKADPDMRRRTARRAILLGAALAVTTLWILFASPLGGDALRMRLLNEGYADGTERLVQHSAWIGLKVVTLAALACALLMGFLRKPRQPRGGTWLLAGVVLLALPDLLMTNRHYVGAHHYRHLLAENAICSELDAHPHDRRLKMLPPGQPFPDQALNNLRLTLFQLRGYDLFDPVSAPRMPDRYSAFLDGMGEHPIRLWQLGSVRYFLSVPGAVDYLNALDGNRGRFREVAASGLGVVEESYAPDDAVAAGQKWLRLIRFDGALPKYRFVARTLPVGEGPDQEADALRLLASAAFDPAQTALVHGEQPPLITPADAPLRLRVVSDAPAVARLETQCTDAALLVRSVYYDPHWTVEIDGARHSLLRVNTLFQGVVVPAGRHEVLFRYRPPTGPLLVAGAARLLLLLGILLVGRRPS